MPDYIIAHTMPVPNLTVLLRAPSFFNVLIADKLSLHFISLYHLHL